ncbi:MAG: AsmA-like C-terminal region-containing protein [Parabacteroides sp.]|nr:AsmA-like C-terminal region-containing protein [Parabacteroides sp.]
MKKSNKIITTILLTILSLVVIIPAIAFSVLNWGILPPKKLTPIVVEQANQYLQAQLDCEHIELTYFETYPFLGVKLINGYLLSEVAKEDTLLAFGEVTVAIQPLDYFLENRITIKDFSLMHPRFYGYVDSEGKANWEIYESSSDSTSSQSPLPAFDIQKIRIHNGHFIYENQQDELFAEIAGFDVRLDGSLRRGANLLRLETRCSSFHFQNPSYSLKNKLAFRLKSGVMIANQYQTFGLKDAELYINEIPFTANGAVRHQPEEQQTRIDLDMGLKISNINDLREFIPDAYLQDPTKMEAGGSIQLKGGVHGLLGDSILPDIHLSCLIDEGYYRIKENGKGFDTLALDLDLHLNGPHPDSSFLSLKEFKVKGQSTALTMQGRVRNLFRNPFVQANLKGEIDFTKIGKELLNPDTLLLEGIMKADLSATFTMDDLLASRFGKIHSSGMLNIDQLKAYSRPYDIDLFVSNASLKMDTTHQQSRYINKGKEQQLVRFTLGIDSLNMQYKEEINTNVSHLELFAQTSPVIDTTSIIPVTGRIAFDHLRTRMPDSVWMVMNRTELKGGIKSSTSNKQIPTAVAVISVDTLKYISVPSRTGAVLAGSTFTIEALPYRDARRQRMNTRTRSDSTKQTVRLRQRSSTSSTDSSQTEGQWLRKWEIRGDLAFQQMRGFSRYFPLPMRMDATKLKFDTNDVTLSDARLYLGKSDFTLNGTISKIRRAFLRGGKLKGDFNLQSEYIDCNQLVYTLNQGISYAESATPSSFNEANLAQLENQLMEEGLVSEPADTTNQLIILPAFLDMALHTNAKRIDFKDLQLEQVEGEVVLRNQSINLSKLQMQSNMGKGNLTMAYTAHNEQEATAGFDLSLEEIQVERLISLFPSMDTLMPMLRSFEGVLDCQIIATCRLDSTLSLIMPSINSSCYLHGNDMVLLDGETFTEISKTLMFKNKERNMIDSISVDLAIKDSRIEVFPFLIEMDRYRVAVGGTHKLDMTFDYHLSVLKSPVPFKLGIDITGNLDDFNFKITKCKYKDLFKAAKQAELDSTRTNIRKRLQDAVRQQLIESAPELGNRIIDSHTSVRNISYNPPR